MSVSEVFRNCWTTIDQAREKASQKCSEIDIRIHIFVGLFFTTCAAVSGIAFAATGSPVALAAFVISLIAAGASYLSDACRNYGNFIFYRREHHKPTVLPIVVPVRPHVVDSPPVVVVPVRHPVAGQVRHPVGGQPHVVFTPHVPAASLRPHVVHTPPVVVVPVRPPVASQVRHPVGGQPHVVVTPHVPAASASPHVVPIPPPAAGRVRHQVGGQPRGATAPQGPVQDPRRTPMGGNHAGRHVVGGNHQ